MLLEEHPKEAARADAVVQSCFFCRIEMICNSFFFTEYLFIEIVTMN